MRSYPPNGRRIAAALHGLAATWWLRACRHWQRGRDKRSLITEKEPLKPRRGCLGRMGKKDSTLACAPTISSWGSSIRGTPPAPKRTVCSLGALLAAPSRPACSVTIARHIEFGAHTPKKRGRWLRGGAQPHINSIYSTSNTNFAYRCTTA